MIIWPNETPIIDDFYSVSGSDIPADAAMEFATAAGVVTIVPDFIRPHLALVQRLSSSISQGKAVIRMTSPTAEPSNLVSVTVTDGSPQAVRLLNPGEAKESPYTIVFVANPSIVSALNTIRRDPVMTNRPAYHEAVVNSLHSLFMMSEDLLRLNNIDAKMRLVSIFDQTKPAVDDNSLVNELPASVLMATRQELLRDFLASFGFVADVVFVVHGSLTHTRPSAWHTTDDATLGGTAYTFDGVAREHGHFPRIPGSAAIPVRVGRGGVVLHEFGHAASDINNGMIIDLSGDQGLSSTRFLVNKKFRSRADLPVPASFANYNGTTFAADLTRCGMGYGNLRSFHPDPVDATRPNLMDTYFFTDDPTRCRFDRLTFKWLTDRLNAKLSR